jgi:lycopene beta-cyclase
MTKTANERVDVALVGGGLQSALIALALRAHRPDVRVTVFERARELGGDHLWSFHAADVPPSCAPWVEPLVVHRWPAHEVRFPGLRRRIKRPYASVSSRRLVEVMDDWARRPGARLVRGVEVVRVDAGEVELANETVIEADLVVDARGPGALPTNGRVAFQKFVGLELALDAPLTDTTPLLMDAEVPQTDGFRFVYVLPFTSEHVLVEDTYFSDSPVLDGDRISQDILAYAEARGFRVRSIVRRERGVLPLPIDRPAPNAETGPLVAGYAGGFFHPTTGYSFPAAVRLAACVASSPPAMVNGSAGLARLAKKLRAQAHFATFLNRMLYGAFAPDERFHVLERFYRLPEETITRFYALETTSMDRARIVCGKPPRGFDIAMAMGSRGAE